MKHYSITFLIIFLFFSVAYTQSCQQFLLDIAKTYTIDKNKAMEQLAPYLLNSGKYLQDLGFPQSCMKLKNSNYTTVQFFIEQNHFNFTIYYGFCFTNLCTVNDLNSYKNSIMQIIKNFTPINIPNNSNINFVYSSLNSKMQLSAVLIYILIITLIILGMYYSVKIWIKQCKNVEQNQLIQSFQNAEILKQQQLTWIKRISLEYKCTKYLFGKKQKSYKIISFSIFKLFCIPMIILGQQFYLRNYAAFNYFSFQNQIYSTFYSKIAIFSVYLPDTLFFISAYLLAIKCLKVQNYGQKQFINFFKTKLFRLYPIYLLNMLIYWFISPTIYAGPVWFVYQNQVSYCDSRWWRSLLLIDNWFKKHNCFSGGWFIQAQMQCVILCLLFFLIYRRIPKIATVLYLILLILFLVISLVFSPKMPVSIQNTLSHHFFDYVKSTYSHLFFYFLGIGVAIIKSIEEVNIKIEQFLLKKKLVQICFTIVSLGMIILILLRPSVWATASGLQFSLSRLGVFASFLLLFFGGIFRTNGQNITDVHKYAHYSYPVTIFSSIVTGCSVWGFSSLSFVSGDYLLNLLITQMSISLIFGTLIGIITQYRPLQKQL